MILFRIYVTRALNCTWKPISRSDECDIGFQEQFNAEFPCQVMNFPIEEVADGWTQAKRETCRTIALSLKVVSSFKG